MIVLESLNYTYALAYSELFKLRKLYKIIIIRFYTYIMLYKSIILSVFVIVDNNFQVLCYWTCLPK